MLEEIGQRLIEIRKKNGYTRQQLADELGMPYTTIRNYETGAREPGHRYIIAIAKKFNVSADYILGIKNESPSQSDKTDIERLSTQDIIKIFAVSNGIMGENQTLTEKDYEMLSCIKSMLEVWFSNKEESS